MKRTAFLLLLLGSLSARASSVAALGDIACGVYTNTATVGIPCVTNEWLDSVLHVDWGTSYTPAWWTDYGVTKPNASPAPDAAATTGQLKWCVRQTVALLDNVATNVGGAGPWLSWTAEGLPLSDNDSAVTVAEFAALVEPVVDRVQQLEIDSMYTPAEWASISALFDYGSYSNELVSLAQLKNVFNFDPEIDSYADGIPDWWQRYYGLIDWGQYGPDADPGADFDWDGLADYEEWLAGTDPTDRDTDGDGLVDGVDPDPSAPDDGTDANGNGVPDSFEVFWFGSTAATPSPWRRDGSGFTLLGRMAAGLCPTNASPEPPVHPLDGLRATPLPPRFGTEAVSNEVVWERTFAIGRHGAWEQYFVSSCPDPLSSWESGYGAWSLDGLVLEWEDSSGGSGTASSSPEWTTCRLPVSTNSPATLTLRLRATRTGFAQSPVPLHLLEYAPTVSCPGLPSEQRDGIRLAAAALGEEIPLLIDRSHRPCSSAIPADEEAALGSILPPDASYARTSPDGATPVQGTLSFRFPELVAFPQIAREASALRSAPAPTREFLLAILDPELRFGGGHAWRGWDVGWDWIEGRYVRESPYPLDSACLWRAFRCDADGWYVCNCEPELDTGAPPEYEDWFDPELDVDGQNETATGRIFLGGSLVWSNSIVHLRWYPDWEDLSDDCGCDSACATCEDAEGPSQSSLAFRIPLGQPREGQFSGFLWFRTEGPVEIEPSLFKVLAREDATVSDTTDGTNRLVSCFDERGRTVEIEALTNGVRATVRLAASGSLEHTWEIVNEGGSTSRVRLRRISRLNNVMSDELYVHDGSDWNVVDPVANTLSSLRTTDLLDDPEDPTFTEERVLADASDPDRVYSHTVSVSRRYGDGASAVLREVERREDVGTPFEKTTTASYWEDGGGRAGLPRLVAGDARAWSWTDYDETGRPVLAFEQRDGSATPQDGAGWTLADHPSFAAFATVNDYTPLAGDSNHRDDVAAVRTQSRYAIDGLSSNLISRSWSVYVRGTNAGLPFVSVRTERAASQGAAFGDPSNAVSVAVSVDPDAEGVPLLLRGRPLSYTGEDGVTTSYDYAFGSWNPATRTFAASSGASHLRTRTLATTPEAPNGVPLVSTVSETVEDGVHGNEVWSATRVLLADGSLSDPFDWESRVYDDQDRLRSTLYSDGSASTNAYSCCRLLFTVDRNGFRRERLADTGTDHLRHAWLDVSFASLPQNHATGVNADHAVPGAYPNAKTSDFRATKLLFDPLGREISRRVMATRPLYTNSIGSLRAVPVNGIWESVETNFYPFGVSDYRVHVDARGLLTVTDVYRDESADETWTASYEGSNLLECAVARSVRGGGRESYREWDDGWTRSLSFSRYGADGCRTDFSVSMASDAPAVTNSVAVSDFLGRTARVTTPLSDSAYVCDGASSRVLSVSDSVSGLSTATLYDALREPVGSVSAGVSSFSTTRYELSSGAWWRVTETREAAGARTNLLSTVRERLTGLSDARRSETVSIPAGGPTTTTLVSFDPATLVSTKTVATGDLYPLVVRSKFGRVFETEERDGTVRRSYFDSYGRPYLTGDQPFGGTFLWRTWTIRDAVGDVTDEVELTLGSLPAIGLAQGHASAIVTYPNNDANQTKWRGLLTQYAYDIRGNLVASRDKEGNVTQYERDSIGRLVGTSGAEYPSVRVLDAAGRLAALGTTRGGSVWDPTSWDYDAATGLCTNKTYADGTRVRHTFAPDGLPLRTTLASGAWTQNAYDANRRLSSVTTSDHYDDYDLSYDDFGRVSEAEDGSARHVFERDAIGRVTNELHYGGRPLDMLEGVLSRTWDACGRPAGTALEYWDDFKQATCYDWGMDGNLAGMTLSNAQGRALEVCYGWEAGRLQGYDVTAGGRQPVFSLWIDRAPRRPRLVTACTSGNDDGDVRSLSYAYDAVGRPVERGSDAFAYDARGEVTSAVLDGSPYRYAYDHIGNRTSATEAGATTAYAANAVNQYTAVGSEEPEYDEDGNLVDDGTRAYEWTAAGRLVAVSDDSVRVLQDYDWRGRRTNRLVERFDGGYFVPSEDRIFVYDDWNLIHEYRYDYDEDIETEIEYFWGPDLSGTLQGAGGVGGLVAVSVDGDYYFPGYDNNGNVIGYWNEDGEIVAEYAYDAFGNTIYEDGNMADFFPHRFSTKYYDTEADLYYYGYRYYSPSLGRWISRDPIEEDGGNNLFLFCRNSPYCSIDTLGMMALVFITTDKLPDSEEKNAAALSDGKRAIRRFLQDFDAKYPNEASFETAKKAGKIWFWGEKVNASCSRDQYRELAKRELESCREFYTKGTFNGFLDWLRPKHVDATSPIDVICIATHGDAPSDGDPTGLVFVGDDMVEGRLFKEKVRSILYLKNLIVMYCYQTWEEGKDKNETSEDYVLWQATANVDPKTGCAKVCPFSVFRRINGKVVEHWPPNSNSSQKEDLE